MQIYGSQHPFVKVFRKSFFSQCRNIYLCSSEKKSMKVRIIFYFLIGLVFLQCNSSRNEPVEIGEITERPIEEVVSNKNNAPEFALKSIDGKEVALSDLKGKVVYVDVWATWCRPCLMQIPALKEVEEIYKDEDVEFVSISIDNERNKGKWENMVREKELGGLQLFAGSDPEFHKNYQISTIPRFLLIGKEGELIHGNAPRPLNHRTNQVNQELLAVLDQLIKE